MKKTYTVEWLTLNTHRATITAESEGEIYRNFGFLDVDDATITDERHIDGTFKILKSTNNQ